MKLLILSKSRPMGRDLIEDPYGRFYNLARYLAAEGHSVEVLLMDYSLVPPRHRNFADVHWASRSAVAAGADNYFVTAVNRVRQLRPDWILGFSDIYFGVLAESLASLFQAKSLIDAYDNYEGYIPWCMPLHWLWQRALRRATAVTAAGPALLELMSKQRKNNNAAVVPMAVDSVGFEPLSRHQCRDELNLPQDVPLIGYTGSISVSRGISILYEALELLRKDIPECRLVMTGPLSKTVALPAHVDWLGTLPRSMVPKVINAMNVVAIVNRPSKFGNYSYPIKLYEAMRCGAVAVATRTPATESILQENTDLLVEPDSPVALAERLKYALALPVKALRYGPLLEWDHCAGIMHNLLVGA